MHRRRLPREEPARVFTVGDLQEAVDRAHAVGLGDDAPVYVQTRFGRRLRRWVTEMRRADVDWLDPTDNFRVVLLVTRSDWKRRE